MKKKLAKLSKLIKNPKVLRPLMGVILALVVLVALFFVEKTRSRVSIEDSLIQAPISTIAPITPGTLNDVYVTEGQKVAKGDALALVDTNILRANSSGLVVMAKKDIGSTVSLQTPIVQMIDTTSMRVAGTIDENKGLSQIKPAQIVSFTVDALPGKTFWGYVDTSAYTANQTQLSFSISSERPVQQFEVYARFDAQKFPEIKNGMSAKMTVYTNTN